jgi:hypothetical protein
VQLLNRVSESIDVLALGFGAGLDPTGKPISDKYPVLHPNGFVAPADYQSGTKDGDR